MTSRSGSRGPHATVQSRSCLTLKDVLEAVAAAANLSPRQRQDIASAVRTVARVSNQGPERLSCDVRSVRRLLEQIKPAAHQISHGRWNNVRSLVFKALALAGVPVAPGRSHAPISAEWCAALQPLPERPGRVALRPLARWCTAQKVEPPGVDVNVIEAFGRFVEECSGRRRPRATLTSAVRAWNMAVQAHPDRTFRAVELASRRKVYARPFDQFPATLKADIDAMVQASLSPDPVDPTSRRPIRQATADNRVRDLLLLASAMVDSGVDTRELTSISALVDVARVKAGLRIVHQRLGGRKTTHLLKLAKLIHTLAKYWVQAPADQLEQLNAIRRHVDPKPQGMTPKNRATLRAFDDQATAHCLLMLADRMWRGFRPEAPLTISQAVQLQVALAIEFLIHAPIRSGNLASLKLGEHLIRSSSGKRDALYVAIPAEQVKNGVAIEFELPARLIRLMDLYTCYVRPLLERGTPSAFLFPGKEGGHKGPALLSEQISRLVEREVGERLTAHQFRHLVGYLYLKAKPGGHEVVRRLLGHRSIETTLQFYAGMEVAEAARHYDAQIEALRNATPASAQRRRRVAT